MRKTNSLIKPQAFNVYDKEGWIEKEEPEGCFFDDRPMISDPLNGAVINFSHYREGFWKSYHRHKCSHGIYVIDGQMKADDKVYGPGSFVWDPAGYCGGHGAAPGSDCLFLFISNLPFDIEFLDEPAEPVQQTLSLSKFNIFDGKGWIEKEEPVGNPFYDKPMIVDPQTGMVVNFSRYPRGFEKPRHRFDCAHGVYIIRGRLATEGVFYGPGSFIWYPAGCVCEQVATADEDCYFLFVTVRDYRIEFL